MSSSIAASSALRGAVADVPQRRLRPQRAATDTGHVTHAAYRPDIDGLRALAIGLVVVFHAWPTLCPGGFAGVDVFFVISGYLITGIIAREAIAGTFSYLTFYARRIRRLAPALVVVLAATLAMGWLWDNTLEFKDLSDAAAASALFSANVWIYFNSGYFDGLASHRPLLHMWSLGVEEQFYFVWPTLILLCVGQARRARLWLGLGLVTLASFALNVALYKAYPTSAYFLLPFRLWEMSAGGLLALRHLQAGGDGTRRMPAHARSWAHAEGVAGLLLIVVGAALLSERTPFPGWAALLPVAGAVLLIDAGPASVVNRLLLGWRPAVLLGLISYPLYLWHWPLLIFARRQGLVDAASIGLVVAAAGALAWATMHYVETPLRRGSASAPRRNAIVQALALGLACIAIAGQVAPAARASFLGMPAWAIDLVENRQDHKIAYRFKSCFLDLDQAWRDYSHECEDAVKPAGDARPAVVLWGDSHAAHLYPGIRAAQQETPDSFRLLQYTASGCPPLIGYSLALRPHCKDINEHVLARIAQLKPHTIVLAAYWARYDGIEGWDTFDLALLTKTIVADLNIAMYGRHAEAPLPIVAAYSPSHCFHAAIEAARIALKYRTPVILLSDGYIANGSEPWLLPDVDSLPDISTEFATEFNHTAPDGTDEYWPYLRDPETLARPWAIPGTPKLMHRVGGLEKQDGSGDIDYTPQNHERMVHLRAAKIAGIANDIPLAEVVGDADADVAITHERIRAIRRVLDEYDGDRACVGEVYLLDEAKMAEYYGDHDELQLSFNFSFLWAPWDASVLRAKITSTLGHLGPRGAWPTWVLSNHDVPRHRQRYGGSEANARIAAVMLLTLPGTPFMYQGEELGLMDAIVPADRVVDPGGRDGCRAPVPWTPDATHGWPAEPWLPFAPDVGERNVASLQADPDSILHLYRDLLALRHGHAALQHGSFTMLDRSDDVIAYVRSEGDRRFVIALNLGDEEVDVAELDGGRILLSTEPHDAFSAAGAALAGRSALVVLCAPPLPA